MKKSELMEELAGIAGDPEVVIYDMHWGDYDSIVEVQFKTDIVVGNKVTEAAINLSRYSSSLPFGIAK